MDRQDRYFVFKNCPNLTNFFAELLNRVADHSFTLQQDGTTRRPQSLPDNPLLSRRTAHLFRISLSKAVNELIEPSDDDCSDGGDSSSLDTVVYPLVQMGHYGIRQDELVTSQLLSTVKRGDRVYLASGYFNLPPRYTDAIFRGQGLFRVLAASPQV